MKELEKNGLMRPAGRAAFAKREKAGSPYSYENRKSIRLAPKLEKRLRADDRAWKFFNEQPASHRHMLVFYVMSAKQDATRERRLDRLIDSFRKGRRYTAFAPNKGA